MTAKIKGTRSRRKKAKASLAPDLNADQARAVAALTAAIHRGDPMCRLLGYAGTGKSFAVVRLLQSYVSQRPVLLTAPTNKAAAVLRAMALEIGGQVRATTDPQSAGVASRSGHRPGSLPLEAGQGSGNPRGIAGGG